MNLYSDHAQSFSDKRWRAWNGWENLIPYFKKLHELKILDLGCGNGRFLTKVQNEELRIKKYVGLDNSDILLNIAKKDYPDYEFLKIDLEAENWSEQLEPKTYNLITSFGLMHHIHEQDQKVNILKKSFELLENGYMIFSFWQFKDFPEFLEKHLIEDLRNNDFLLSWGGKDSGATRFCHHFDLKEIDELEKLSGLKRISEFSSDGIENKMNKYIIWQKKL